MDKESIRHELIRRATALPEFNQSTSQEGVVDLFATVGKLKGTPAFAQKLSEILSDIIKEQGIIFTSDSDRADLTAFIKPTNTELIKKYMAS